MAFWKPGTAAPDKLYSFKVDRDDSLSELSSLSTALNRHEYPSNIKEGREKLPIYKHKTAILYLVENHATTVVVGQTGSGKSTQIPQYLAESGWATGGRVIACTQPRRVAVQTVALRVAEEKNCKIGEEVGYSIRFENVCTHGLTQIKYLTDGTLIREMMTDPLLSNYSVIMIDEAHERNICTDLLLGLLKKVQKIRPNLRLIISSATLEAKQIASFFDNLNTKIDLIHSNLKEKENLISRKPAIISIEGRSYPVEIHYLEKPCSNYILEAVKTAINIIKNERLGDILIFLTGQEEIMQAVDMISTELNDLNTKAEAVPFFSGLSKSEQEYAIHPFPKGKRKIIVSTNICESSVTIEGIVYVIDSGFVKQKFYNPMTDVESLVIFPISKNCAVQRAGRCGRVRPGKCYRLYTENYFLEEMQKNSIPEIQRSDLTDVVLQLKALGIDHLMRFDFLNPPSPHAMCVCLEKLYALKAVDDDAKLTKDVGCFLSETPLDGLLGTILFKSVAFKCSQEIISILSSLCVKSVWVQFSNNKKELEEIQSKFAVAEGDLITNLNVYESFIKSKKSSKWCHQNLINYQSMLRIMEIRIQLKNILKRFSFSCDSCQGDVDSIRKAIASGLFLNAAQLDANQSNDGFRYRSIRGNNILKIHPSSILFRASPKWVVYHSVVQIRDELYMKDLTSVDSKWLTELAPHFFEIKKLAV